MTKINQIQNALLEQEGGAFQKLADAYLHAKEYEQINSLGSLIGADRVRKGTPDTFVSLPNGKYIFVEHTTEKNKLNQKLKGDLNKCFDKSKTGIPIEKIDEIVICHTSNLRPEEEDRLREECQKRGVKFSIFGISPISYDLYRKYPGIAKDFLGISVDTGQVLHPNEFVAAYNRSPTATPLDTTFHFRSEELELGLKRLEESYLMIVSGKAGVGKSRLALEFCKIFKEKHPEYEVRCIFNRGPDLFEDLRVYFSRPGYFLIFADDVNRVNRFEYFIQLLLDQRADQQIKVIATVRDYALDKVQDLAQSYSDWRSLEIQPLEEEQIKHLIENEYSIRNHLYLDRIASISQRSPRLAIMAAKLAIRENTLASISNVSSLYDQYYRSIRQDLKEFYDETLLKVAGIVSFLHTVDHSDQATMQSIEAAFQIPQEEFWQTVRQLHNLELLDMHENEVVRTSDQVLATYLFYLAFFKERSLDFGALLEHFFPHLRHRLVDALNPVLNAFDRNRIIEVMRPSVDQAWKVYQEAGNKTNLMHLMEVFWFLKKTEILLYFRSWVSRLEPESINLSELEIKPNSNLSSPSFLKILSAFRGADENTFQMALSILLDYIIKQPSNLSRIFYLLTERFGFERDSYAYGFYMQRVVINLTWDRGREGADEMFSRLFLAVAEQYLFTRFDTSEMKGRLTVSIIKFDLTATPELFNLRQTIWQCVFQLYQLPTFKEKVLNLLHNYNKYRHKLSVDEIIRQDAVEVLPFLESALSPSNYCHCLVVQNYMNCLEDHNVPFSQGLRDRFTNKVYKLSQVLLFDSAEKKNHDLGHEEYRKFKKRQIEAYFENYRFTDYQEFVEQCLEIQKETERRHHNQCHFPSRVVEVLITLANREPNLYVEVLKHYLSLGDPLKLNELRLVEILLRICGVEKTYIVLDHRDYQLKRKWLFAFYHLLPQAEIKPEYLEQLYILYQESEPVEIPNDLDFLLKYRSLDNNVVVQVTKIALLKLAENQNYIYPLFNLFNPSTEVNKVLSDIFINNLTLLKQAYIAALETNWNWDFDGKSLSTILDFDPSFILEYIDWLYEKGQQHGSYEPIQDYSFIWRRDDCERIMKLVINHFYQHDQVRFQFWNLNLETFFLLDGNAVDNPLLQKRQNHLLKGYIENESCDSDFMVFIFRIISQFSLERRKEFIAIFLSRNLSFEDFKRLSLSSNSTSWVGSAVPEYQKQLDYLQSLLPLFNTIDLLPHKQHIERTCSWLQEKIDRVKKGDFMND